MAKGTSHPLWPLIQSAVESLKSPALAVANYAFFLVFVFPGMLADNPDPALVMVFASGGVFTVLYALNRWLDMDAFNKEYLNKIPGIPHMVMLGFVAYITAFIFSAYYNLAFISQFTVDTMAWPAWAMIPVFIAAAYLLFKGPSLARTLTHAEPENPKKENI